MAFEDNPPPHRHWLGVMIAKRRSSLDMSVKECADMIGISDTALRDLERGKGSAKWDTICLVSDKLGLRIWGYDYDIQWETPESPLPTREQAVAEAGGSKLLAMMHALNAGAEVTAKFPAGSNR